MERSGTIHACEEITGYSDLKELALNFSWSWDDNHASDHLWEQLNPSLWKITRNPWAALQTVSKEKLKALFADPTFCQSVKELIRINREAESSPRWFQKKHGNIPFGGIAYFSMEFMLAEALPIYSGGLGNVAGDQLKAASDLGVPVYGVGLLYQQGYFRQLIDNDGNQKALYPYNSPEQLPITPLRLPNGEWLRIEILFPGWSVWLRIWEVRVGRVRLFLIDSNDIANFPPYRGITSELYGGDLELRLKQEMILGIVGWRLFEALGIQPDVCHLNEGHAAFAVLERASSFMRQNKVSFDEALAATRAGNLFTTHTAVPAGFDRFPPDLIEKNLALYDKNRLGIGMQKLLSLGRLNPNDSSEPFNMAYLAMRGSCAVNGVSKLHGKVSRHLFTSLFPRWPEDEVPVGYVTNGIHAPSWASANASKFWEQRCGKNTWAGTPIDEKNSVRHLSDAIIWQARNKARASLIDFCRERLSRILEARGADAEWVATAKQIFDPNALTLGFARRFATYKRPNLLLHDSERLLKILKNPQAPVQLVIAGKAHPADRGGQALIQQWMHFIMRNEVRSHVIFLEDYDMLVTMNLVRGVDLWVNTPKRPWEACGTSGMKVLINGGLNLSELDGWWAEAYSPDVGWALGDGLEHGDDPISDAADAEQLYTLLENEVVPAFYRRTEEGIASQWVSLVRESMARLTPEFSADRAVRQYTEQYYLPAAKAYRERSENNAAIAKKIVQESQFFQENWNRVRFGDRHCVTNGDNVSVEQQLYLGDITPEQICVELYADGCNGKEATIVKMECAAALTASQGLYVYRAKLPKERLEKDFTARVKPVLPEASLPIELKQILWQY